MSKFNSIILALVGALAMSVAFADVAASRSVSSLDNAATERVHSGSGRGPEIKPYYGPHCPWIPREELRPSPQCGYNDLGVAEPGLYECGVKSNGERCESYCRFVRCWSY